MKRILLSLVIIFSSIVSTQNLFGQRVGINTNAPSAVFHINKGTAAGDNPLRAEGFLSFQANDSTVLVVNPADGTIRYMSFADLSNQITLDTNQVMGIVLTKADTLFNNNAFVDSIISVMIQNGDTLLSNPTFTDSLFTLVRDSLLIDINFNTSTYTYIKDSLLLDTAWLSTLGDSIDNQNLDSMTLNQTLLGTYIESGLGASVDLLPLASDSTFYRTIRDSLLGDSVFVSSIDSLLLSDSSFINGVIDSLLTNVYFKDSIFIYTRDSLIYDQAFIDSMFTSIRDSIIFDSKFFDSIYSLASDSLLLDSAWLAALNDSIDDQNLDSMVLSGTTLTTYIEDGTAANEDLLPLASDSSFVSTIASDSNFINTLTNDSLFISNLTSDSSFVDSLLGNSYFTDSVYSITSDSLLLDSAWLAALNDSIDDQNLDSMTLNSTILTTYIEDGTAASQDLLPLASDSSFYSTIRDSLLGDSVFTSSVDSILRADTNFMNGIVDSLLTNVYFKDSIFTYTRDSLIYDQAFIDSMFTSIRDSIIFDSKFFDSIYSLASDSLLLDSAWLAALNDSIDDQNLDSMVLNGTTLTTYIEDGTAANEDLLPLASDSSFVSTIASDSNFINTLTNDSLFISNLTSDSSFVDSLLGNSYFTDSIYTLNRDSLLLDTNFLNAVADSIDSDVDSAILVGDDTINIYEDGKIIPVDISALKDSAQWVSGDALGLNANDIYARKAFGFGDTVVIRGFGGQNGFLGLGIPSPTRRLHVGGGAIFTSNSGTNVRFQNNAGTRYAEFLINSGTLELDGGSGSFNINRFTNANLVMNDGGGRVSIGRKSGIPGRLTVFGFTADATDYALVVGDSNNAPVNHLLSVRNDGNVGIQTSAPTQALDVNGQARIRTINDTNDIAGVLTADAQGVIQNMPYDTLLAKINDSSEWVDGSLVGLTAGNIYARKALANGDTVVIDTSGKLGIGTNNPMRDLHISNSAPTLTLENSSNTNTINMRVLADGSSLIRFKDESSKGRNYDIGTGTLFTDTGSLVIRDVTSSSRRFVIDSTGFIGIGNIIPTKKIDVDGEARIRTINDTNDIAGVLTADAQGVIQNMPYDTLLAKINDSSEWVDGSLVGLTSGAIYARKALANGDTIFIDTSGYFGVGLSNPRDQFVVGNHEFTFHNGGNDVLGFNIFHVDGTGFIKPDKNKFSGMIGMDYINLGQRRALFLGVSNEDSSTFNSYKDIVIDTSNLVGIGTEFPSHKLDIDGEIRVRTINDTNLVDNILVARADGNIQKIDFDTLQARLADSSEWVDGSLVGLTAGSIYARKALAKGDTVIIDTSGNLGIGISSPRYRLDVDATINTYGEYSIDSITALSVTPNGATGIGNTAVGHYALDSLTSGVQNTAIGFRTLISNTSGTRNTAVGYQALRYNNNGLQNTAVGVNSLTENISGNFNAGFGKGALKENISGNYNVALGADALFDNLTGSKNIAIGKSAGDNLLSGDKNIIIGDSIDFPSTTDSNQLNIANIIYGVDIDGINNTLSTGNIGIGVQSPSNKLHVTATSNPLRLEGVQTGANTDSILTIDATGVVRKLDYVAPNASTFISITASTAIADGDNTEVVFANSTLAAINITLPDATLNAGERIIIKWTAGGNAVTVSSVSTIDGSSSLVASGDDIEYMSDGTQWWVIRR